MTRAVLAALLVLHGAALADRRPAGGAATNPSLVEARRAVVDVRYDDARRLLVEALERGRSRPDELREIYLLSAATALVLGQADLAEQYYRRVLALDPAATLPVDASPRLREPFIAAQAYMAAQARLAARAIRKADTIEVTVTDPLDMVVAVTAIVDGAALPRVAFTGQPVVLAPPRGTLEEVQLLDAHGNTVRVIDGASLAAAPITAPVSDRPVVARTPLVRRWVTWAIPAAVFTGTGIGFLLDAQRAKDRLDTILANDTMHFFGEAEEQRTRWKSHTLIADVAFGVAGVFAVTAIVVAVNRPTARAVVVPAVGDRQVGFALHAKF